MGFACENEPSAMAQHDQSAEFLLEHEYDPIGGPGMTIQHFNEDIQMRLSALRASLFLFGIDVVEVPAYLISEFWWEDDPPAQSMLPDMVNLLYVNGYLIVPDPSPHLSVVNDPFKWTFMTRVDSLGATIRWIDCLEYHYGVGEVHCGTNVRRVPRPEIREWWLHEP